MKEEGEAKSGRMKENCACVTSSFGGRAVENTFFLLEGSRKLRQRVPGLLAFIELFLFNVVRVRKRRRGNMITWFFFRIAVTYRRTNLCAYIAYTIDVK